LKIMFGSSIRMTHSVYTDIISSNIDNLGVRAILFAKYVRFHKLDEATIDIQVK
jgi:hypothetical protein